MIAIGDAADLFQKMADVDDRDARTLELFDHAKQVLDVVLRERAGRLVEHDHLGVDHQRPGNLDELLIGDRKLADRDVERQVSAAQQLRSAVARAARCAPALHEAAAAAAPGRA